MHALDGRALAVDLLAVGAGLDLDRGLRLCVLDQLDPLGVDAEAELLAQQPADIGRHPHLVDAGHQPEPQQTEATVVVGLDLGVGDTGERTQRRSDVRCGAAEVARRHVDPRWVRRRQCEGRSSAIGTSLGRRESPWSASV